MAKSQFQQGEPLQIRFPAFLDKTTGDQILGTDTVTYVARRPDNTTTASTPMTYDATMAVWTANIATGSFQAGEWLVRAVSDNVNTNSQSKTLTWGDYVDDISATRRKIEAIVGRDLGGLKQSTAVAFAATFLDADGAPLNAIVPANVTLELIKASGAPTTRALTAPEFAFLTAGRYRVSLPAGDFNVLGDLRLTMTDSVSGASSIVTAFVVASTSTDAALQLSALDLKVELIRKIQTNRNRVDATTKQFLIYDDDDTTVILTFDLFDEAGVATATRIFERRP